MRIIAPGRVYRRDNFDLTHTPMFQQVEGLVADDGITMGDLKGTIIALPARAVRARYEGQFRPSFFPYTEPSADVFIGCQMCKGSGCGMCKRTGWLEILGCGMVHPAVFEAVGYDPRRITGFAFGMGIERVAMLAYRAGRHPAVLRKRPALPGTVSDMKVSSPGCGISWRSRTACLSMRSRTRCTCPASSWRASSVEGVAEGDAVVDFEITANRPDTLSVIGLAREISAL